MRIDFISHYIDLLNDNKFIKFIMDSSISSRLFFLEVQ
jgi:hypothetical protein